MSDVWNEYVERVRGGRDAALYCSLAKPDLLRVTGDDALSFLEAQLINTIPPLGEAPRYNGYCSPGGRLHATLMVWRDDDGLLLHTDPGLADDLTARLSKYILRAKVRITKPEPALCAAGLIGEAWLPLLEEMHDRQNPQYPFLYRAPGSVPCAPNNVSRCIALAENTAQLEALRERINTPAQDASSDIWHAARICGGTPLITPDTGDRFIPQILNMDTLGGVSFDKGCYPGQEVIARLHFKGRRKTAMQPCHLHTTATPQAGETVFAVNGDKRATGIVVSSARMDQEQVVLQAVLPIDGAHSKLETESAPGAALQRCETPDAAA